MPNRPRQPAPATDEPVRCQWSLTGSDRMLRYHDEEWGVPVRDSRQLFAKLILDGAQAGLSWQTILHRQEGYLRAFDGLAPERMAAYDEGDQARLLADPGIIRNRAKVRSAIGNARAFLRLEATEGSFARWLWAFVDDQPVQNRWRRQAQVPAETPLAQTVSRELRQRGFSFVGPTIVYAWLQAVGVVNDHLVGCFRYPQLVAPAASRTAKRSKR
jgi:DNA-3-methyladenine glycosylase I